MDLGPFSGLRSWKDEVVFQVMAQNFLGGLADPQIAEDLMSYVDLVVAQQANYREKVPYNILPSELDDTLKLDAYDPLFKEWRAGEDRLVAESTRIFDKYKDNLDHMSHVAEAYAKLMSLQTIAKNIARENLLDKHRTKRDRAVRLGKVLIDMFVPGGVLSSLVYDPNADVPLDETRNPRNYVFDKLQDFVACVKQVVLRATLTAHPTNPIRGEYSDIEIEFSKAAREIARSRKQNERDRGLREYFDALKRLHATKMTPTDASGAPISFTPREELDMESRAQKHIYDNIAGPRAIFDAAANNRCSIIRDRNDMYTPEMRLDLRLNIELNSWVNSDKDGNDNIKSDHLLESVCRRRSNILEKYLEETETFKNIQIGKLESPYGKTWVVLFKEAKAAFDAALAEIDLTANKNQQLSQGAFDRLMKATASAFTSSSGDVLSAEDVADEFVKALENEYQIHPKQQDKLIVFIDRARNFRMNFAALELRETSDRYSEVLNYLLKDADLDPEDRVFTKEWLPNEERLEKAKREIEKLKAKKSTEDELRHANAKYKQYEAEEQKKVDRRTQALDRIISDPRRAAILRERTMDFLRNVKDSDTSDYHQIEALVYHTLKRLQLAASHPDAVRDTVLAECKYAYSILEVLALVEGVSGPGENAKRKNGMQIIPLFEQAETLDSARKVILAAFGTKSFRQHLLRLADFDPTKIVLSIMIAHSDNNRRSGAPAARVKIYNVHHTIRQYLQDQMVWIRKWYDEDEAEKIKAAEATGQKYEKISMIGLQILTSFFEGRSQTDSTRGGQRAQTSLDALYKQLTLSWETFQGIDIFNCLQVREYFTRWVSRLISHNAKRIAMGEATGQPEALRRIPVIETAVIGAFEKAEKDYFDRHFNRAGDIFGHPLINNTLNGLLYNRGSRKSSRMASSAAPRARWEDIKVEIVERMRAIHYGNNFLDAGIHPAILGAYNVERYLAESFFTDPVTLKDNPALEYLKDEARKYEYTSPVIDENGYLTPTGLKTLVHISPGFRDVIHFMELGVSATSLERTKKRFDEARASGIANEKNVDEYLSTVSEDLFYAAKLVLGARGFELPKEILNRKYDLKPEDWSKMSFLVRAISNLAPECTFNMCLGILPQIWRDRLIMKAAKTKDGTLTGRYLKNLNHIAASVLLVRHGRLFAADDPHTRDARIKAAREEKPRRIFIHKPKRVPPTGQPLAPIPLAAAIA